jgi:pentapeptide MXKDX repeat protein
MTKQERIMIGYKTMALAVILTTGIAGTAYAQGMAAPKDTMSAPAGSSMAAPSGSMAMTKPMAHKKKAMKPDAMKSNAMKPDSMAAPGH